jgi:hypothetical protein
MYQTADPPCNGLVAGLRGRNRVLMILSSQTNHNLYSFAAVGRGVLLLCCD